MMSDVPDVKELFGRYLPYGCFTVVGILWPNLGVSAKKGLPKRDRVVGTPSPEARPRLFSMRLGRWSPPGRRWLTDPDAAGRCTGQKKHCCWSEALGTAPLHRMKNKFTGSCGQPCLQPAIATFLFKIYFK